MTDDRYISGEYSKAFLLLACEAGRQVGLAACSAIDADSDLGRIRAVATSVADDAEAREIRDDLWMEYERLLRDDASYSLAAVGDWLETHGVTVGKSSIDRDRNRARAWLRRIQLAGEKAKATIAAAENSGEIDLMRAGRIAAGQLLFEALSQLGSDSLADLEPDQIIRMVNSLGKLSASHAAVDLAAAREAELRRQFDQAVRQASQANNTEGLTAETIARIRRAVFGEVAA